MRRVFIALTGVMLALNTLSGHAGNYHQSYSAGEIHEMLEKLDVFGSALYIAAHPDDENTRLITYLARKEKIRTAYISLTRGDGGQNLIGTEKGELLGLIRTHELLSARNIDHGVQFFTRANDFGYSKTHEETLNIWDEEDVLYDMVLAIRRFRPDVLITRFPPLSYAYPTHGHHSASAHLAEIAFDMAGDTNAFPDQLDYVDAWQPKRLYWNTSTWFYQRTGIELDTTDKIMVDVGAYLPAIGEGVAEIAAESRSQHKSQGFGAARDRGKMWEYLEYVKGEKAGDLFEGVDITWGRLEGSEMIRELSSKAQDMFSAGKPDEILPILLDIHRHLEALAPSFWRNIKIEETRELIKAVTGLHLEALAVEATAARGGKTVIRPEAIHRSQYGIRLAEVSIPGLDAAFEGLPLSLRYNQLSAVSDSVLIPQDFPISQPFWLRNEMEGIGMYSAPAPEMGILPVNPDDLHAIFILEIEGVRIPYTVPVLYKWTDRVEGELLRQMIIVPQATIHCDKDNLLFTSQEPKKLMITIKSWKDQVEGTLKFNVPEGWRVSPEEIPVSIKTKGEEALVEIQVNPSGESGEFYLRPFLQVGEAHLDRDLTEIDYDHIPFLHVFRESKVKLLLLDLQMSGRSVGYIMGAGDEVADYLGLIGYEVTKITEQNFNEFDLTAFDAIVIGIRAYNTETWLPLKKDALMDYVYQGGNLVVQYQTTWGLLTQDLGPFNYTIGRDRVTVEDAPVTMLDPGHPVFNRPNPIGNEDFEGWVQERGLYFAATWDEAFEPLLSMGDPGEEASQGSLLLAQYGQGSYFYTGISFFRELPAGVPGAFRLLANILSYERD